MKKIQDFAEKTKRLEFIKEHGTRGGDGALLTSESQPTEVRKMIKLVKSGCENISECNVNQVGCSPHCQYNEGWV